MKKSWVWNDFLQNMCSKDINFTQKLDSFGEALFFYPVANTFSQTNCQIPPVTRVPFSNVGAKYFSSDLN